MATTSCIFCERLFDLHPDFPTDVCSDFCKDAQKHYEQRGWAMLHDDYIDDAGNHLTITEEDKIMENTELKGLLPMNYAEIIEQSGEYFITQTGKKYFLYRGGRGLYALVSEHKTLASANKALDRENLRDEGIASEQWRSAAIWS